MNNTQLQEGDTICDKKYTGRGSKRRVSKVTFHPSVTAYEKVELMLTGYQSMITGDNEYAKPNWADDTFDSLAECGRSYLVGNDVSMADYQKSKSTYIPKHHWLEYAVAWAFENPDSCLKVQLTRYNYRISKRGDTVEIGLPDHGRGGERHWIVYPDNHRKKLLINVD